MLVKLLYLFLLIAYIILYIIIIEKKNIKLIFIPSGGVLQVFYIFFMIHLKIDFTPHHSPYRTSP